MDERRLTGHECPSCGAPVVNAQGLYTCFDCDWAFLSIPTSRERSFEHPVFNHRDGGSLP